MSTKIFVHRKLKRAELRPRPIFVPPDLKPDLYKEGLDLLRKEIKALDAVERRVKRDQAREETDKKRHKWTIIFYLVSEITELIRDADEKNNPMDRLTLLEREEIRIQGAYIAELVEHTILRDGADKLDKRYCCFTCQEPYHSGFAPAAFIVVRTPLVGDTRMGVTSVCPKCVDVIREGYEKFEEFYDKATAHTLTYARERFPRMDLSKIEFDYRVFYAEDHPPSGSGE